MIGKGVNWYHCFKRLWKDSDREIRQPQPKTLEANITAELLRRVEFVTDEY